MIASKFIHADDSACSEIQIQKADKIAKENNDLVNSQFEIMQKIKKERMASRVPYIVVPFPFKADSSNWVKVWQREDRKKFVLRKWLLLTYEWSIYGPPNSKNERLVAKGCPKLTLGRRHGDLQLNFNDPTETPGLLADWAMMLNMAHEKRVKEDEHERLKIEHEKLMTKLFAENN